MVFHGVRLKKFHLKSGFANLEIFEHLKSKSVMEFLPSQDGEASLRNWMKIHTKKFCQRQKAAKPA